MRARGIFMALASLAAMAAGAAPPTPLMQGSEFQSAEVRRLQADDFENPAMLWVTQGEALWNKAPAEGQSCADCHGAADTSMKGVAARYPRFSADARAVLNLSGQIDHCIVKRQRAPALPMESDELLALTAYVTRQSAGLPMAVVIDEHARPLFLQGESRYGRRMGQLNLACAHCHQRNWGRKLFNDVVSQGHGTAYPGYRFEWQKIGSLQRRLRACYFGVRAEMPDYGSNELLALELYLAWRANGLAIEAPGVRR